MNDRYSTIQDVLNPEIDEGVVYLERGQLKPNPNQDRKDWDSHESEQYIMTLAESMSIRLPNGKLFGVRQALQVKPADENGMHEIIAGESRWRAAEIAGLELLPCIIREYENDIEERFDHVTENSIKRNLNLYERALSIKRDRDEYKIDAETILKIHGLSNKAAMSKIMKVFSLREKALQLVKSSHVKDVNLLYDLDKLNDEELDHINLLLEEDPEKSVTQCIRELRQKQNERYLHGNEGPQGSDSEGEGEGDTPPTPKPEKQKTTVDTANLKLSYSEAMALARRLRINEIYTTDVKELVKIIKEKVENLK